MIISQTPLRISFVGGGTDLKSYYTKKTGQVISSAIDKYVFVIVKERFDTDIYVSWSQKKEIVQNGGKIDEIYFCPHLEKENCNCRKPGIGMIEKAMYDFPSIDVRNSF